MELDYEGQEIVSSFYCSLDIDGSGDQLKGKVQRFDDLESSNSKLQISFSKGSILILKLKQTSLGKNLNLGFPLTKVSTSGLNILIYRSDPEEQDNIRGGCYNVPGIGKLPYAGIAGFWWIISRLGQRPDFAECLERHLQEGDWAIDYIVDRLAMYADSSLEDLVTHLSDIRKAYKELPKWRKAAEFTKFIEKLFKESQAEALSRLSPIQFSFARQLALGSYQLIGKVQSTGLYPTSNDACMSAGLPHFATNHMRYWGRDIFIALPGLLLCTGRFDDAKRHLLAFASCYYKGLIPNLLDGGRRPRFNSRDAVWFFLDALRKYCQVVDEAILDCLVPLRFPNDVYVDFDDPAIYSRSVPLRQLVQSIMTNHANGIHFREWNAGPSLDPMMQERGFDIDIQLDRETGFVMGGNAFNCGTWMDKMGESSLAGNRGIPATPRDGAPIELVALLSSTLTWLTGGRVTGSGGVQLGTEHLSYEEWNARIKANFEQRFFVSESDGAYYKDTSGSSVEQSDLQLRPNYLVAMSSVSLSQVLLCSALPCLTRIMPKLPYRLRTSCSGGLWECER